MNFKFCVHIHTVNRNKSPLKILGKVAVGVVRDFRKFSGHPYTLYGALHLCEFSFLEVKGCVQSAHACIHPYCFPLFLVCLYILFFV